MNRNGCELIELQISALLDGEADLHEQANVVDHIMDCAECRRFYKEARELQDLIDEMPTGSATEVAPAGSALPIGGSAALPRGKRFGALRAWSLAAAAVLLLAFGFWAGGNFGAGGAQPVADSSRMPPVGSTIDVHLASNPAAMSDERFLALTLEVLHADQRHQKKLYEILQIIAEESESREGSESGRAWGKGEGGYQIDRAIELDGPGEIGAEEGARAIY